MKNILAGVCMAIWILFIVAMLGLSGFAPMTAAAQSSDVLWRGDAETGDLSQWCASHRAAP